MEQQLYELPERWIAKPIGQIASLVTKGSTPTSYGHKFQNSGINFVKIENITAGKINADGITSFITDEAHQFLKRSQLQEGDLLFSIAGSIGTSALVDASILPANTNQALALIRGYESDAIPEFLLYALRSEVLNETKNKKRGGALQNISLADIKNTIIPLPPLDEQKRIVAKLDALFIRIDAAITDLQETLELSKALFASALDEVFQEAFARYRVDKLKDLTTKIGSGATPRGGEKSYKPEGVSLIRSLNVHDASFKLLRLAHIDNEQADALTNVQVEKGDVLLNITGASVARSCIVPDDVLPARVNQHVSILRPTLELNSFFLNYLVISPAFKRELLFQGASGATRQALTKTMLQNLQIPVPSLEEQSRIVGYVNALSEQTRTLETETQERLEQLTALKSSLLDAAFRGQL